MHVWPVKKGGRGEKKKRRWLPTTMYYVKHDFLVYHHDDRGQRELEKREREELGGL